MEYKDTIHNWSCGYYFGLETPVVVGTLSDKRSIITSSIKELKAGYVKTQNSVYKLKVPITFDFGRSLKWLEDVFEGKTSDPEERVLRLLEEVMELAQTEGVTKEQAAGLVFQVFEKPVGEREQELGGVMVTLAAYLAVTDQDANAAFEKESTRCEQPEIINKIREKHRKKLVISSKSREQYAD